MEDPYSGESPCRRALVSPRHGDADSVSDLLRMSCARTPSPSPRRGRGRGMAAPDPAAASGPVPMLTALSAGQDAVLRKRDERGMAGRGVGLPPRPVRVQCAPKMDSISRLADYSPFVAGDGREETATPRAVAQRSPRHGLESSLVVSNGRVMSKNSVVLKNSRRKPAPQQRTYGWGAEEEALAAERDAEVRRDSRTAPPPFGTSTQRLAPPPPSPRRGKPESPARAFYAMYGGGGPPDPATPRGRRSGGCNPSPRGARDDPPWEKNQAAPVVRRKVLTADGWGHSGSGCGPEWVFSASEPATPRAKSPRHRMRAAAAGTDAHHMHGPVVRRSVSASPAGRRQFNRNERSSTPFDTRAGEEQHAYAGAPDRRGNVRAFGSAVLASGVPAAVRSVRRTHDDVDPVRRRMPGRRRKVYPISLFRN
eukprot:TRINITY_DN16210_c0_g1_i1.p1 TRINITY_DN16210_c0_g1~~TRINITY_DN16210_c0_g1_i1.p1  ORF type:complete len:453 (+),score=94.81 TRINITY_DN16210_c0_g1_i1:91-1359(+)